MATKRKEDLKRAAGIEALVATYAPIGARRRRQQRFRRTSAAMGCALVIGAGALLSMTETPMIDRMGGILLQASAFQDRSDAELATRLAELEARLDGARAQKRELEEHRAHFAEQSRRLALLLDQTETEQSDLEQRQKQGSQLDEEITALAAQRKAIEERWTQFDKQGELLAMEIIAVNAQRKELEVQRRQIERQQKQLAEMLQQASGVFSRQERPAGTEPANDASTSAIAPESFAATSDSLLMANGELDEMRGGFTVGEGMDFSIGFRQAGSINGEEQFNNSFTIDSLASGFDNLDMSNMQLVVLQNGSGNYISPAVMDSLSNSFGHVIQNTLDDQVITTTTTYDIGLHNVSGTMQGLAGEQALTDSLGSF